MIAGGQDQIHSEKTPSFLYYCFFKAHCHLHNKKDDKFVCSSKDVITGVFWRDATIEQVPTSQCESECKFLHLSLLLSIQCHATLCSCPCGFCWFGVFVVVYFFFFLNKVALPASEHRQTQKGIRDTRKGARRWTYFLWADTYLGAGRSWDELSEVKCFVFGERIFFWKVKEKQRCVYGPIWTASCSWCHSIWI